MFQVKNDPQETFKHPRLQIIRYLFKSQNLKTVVVN